MCMLLDGKSEKVYIRNEVLEQIEEFNSLAGDRAL